MEEEDGMEDSQVELDNILAEDAWREIGETPEVTKTSSRRC